MSQIGLDAVSRKAKAEVTQSHLVERLRIRHQFMGTYHGYLLCDDVCDSRCNIKLFKTWENEHCP
jgi:hypothetical protein